MRLTLIANCGDNARMDAKTFHDTYGRERCEQVAKAAKSKLGYFLQIAYGHRRPSPDLAQRLVKASGNKLDFVALLTQKKKKAA